MDAILRTIGCMVLASVIVAIPILVPISFICNWLGGIKLLLILLTIGVWYFICWTLAELDK